MGRWVRSWTALAVVVVLVAALLTIVTIQPSGLSRAQGGWSTTDPTDPTAQLPSGTGTLPSGTGTSGNVHWEVGTYDSDGLQIYGLICYPASGSGDYPMLIINHGLDWSNPPPYPAIVRSSLDGCARMAEAGWLVATSTYRGESIALGYVGPGSPPSFTRTSASANPGYWGGLELCGGEVDDVLNLLSAVKAYTPGGVQIANPNHVLMWGHSHGSCITERAIERGAAPQIAVSVDGPTDFMTWGGSFPVVWGICTLVGESPPCTAAEQTRSSAYDNCPGVLASPTVKFLRIQGEGDAVVPAEQGCELAAALPRSFDNFLDRSAPKPNVFPQRNELPPVCARLPWGMIAQLFPEPGNEGALRTPTFLMYGCPEAICPQGTPTVAEHGWILVQSWPAFATFVNHFASGWNASIPTQFVLLE